MKTNFDAIVVGSGISGGWAAKELCENGLKTLVLERGRMVKHIEDYPTMNLDPWDMKHGGASTQEQLKNLQINYFDFFREFCNVKKPKKLFYKFDPMHLSNKGHKKVFELIDREIHL